MGFNRPTYTKKNMQYLKSPSALYRDRFRQKSDTVETQPRLLN